MGPSDFLVWAHEVEGTLEADFLMAISEKKKQGRQKQEDFREEKLEESTTMGKSKRIQ
jgi:hypothetical protein